MQKYNNCNNLSSIFIYLCSLNILRKYHETPLYHFINKIYPHGYGYAMFCYCKGAGLYRFLEQGTCGWGVGFGTGYTDVTIAPSAIYQFNAYAALGVGIQGTYVHQKDYYDSYIYGGSVIGLFNPIPQVQLSVEMEQLRVNLNVDEAYASYYPDLNFKDRNFWNTALFFGVGYSMGNVTAGLRYNVLYGKKDLVYSDALMPFVRVYF